MDSGKDMALGGEEAIQPTDAVPADVEEVTPAQGDDTEEVELFIEGEGDQLEAPKGDMTEAQVRAAWKEERKKRKDKADQLSQAEKERDNLRKRLEALEGKVSSVTAAPRPDPNTEQFGYDSQNPDYIKALDDWYAGRGNAAKQPEQQTQQNQQPSGGFELSEDQEYHAHKHETEIRKHFKDYDDAVKSVESEFDSLMNGQGAAAVKQIYANAHAFGIDPAKALYALKRQGQHEFYKLAQTRTPYELATALRALEAKVQTRQRKKIDTKPETELSTSGSVNINKMDRYGSFD